MKSLKFVCFGPPVPKGRPRFSRKCGRAFTPSKTRDYEAFVSDTAIKAVAAAESWPVDAKYCVSCTMYFGDKRRRDGINVMMSLQDAMNAVVYDDDSQIKRGHYEVLYDKDDPRLEVCVTVIDDA